MVEGGERCVGHDTPIVRQSCIWHLRPHTGIVRQSGNQSHDVRRTKRAETLVDTRAYAHDWSRGGNMNDALEWGHHYLMVEPNHFRVDYAINPFMHLDDQPDPLRTRAAVAGDSSRRSRPPAARVEVLAAAARRPRHGLRDEPRARRSRSRRPATAGRALAHALPAAPDGDPGRRRLVRRARLRAGARSVATASARTSRPATRSPGAASWSSATARAPRSSRSSTSPPTSACSVRGVRITHPGMYHMDLGFCPLDETRAMVCPAAYDEASRGRPARPRARAAGAHRGGGA